MNGCRSEGDLRGWLDGELPPAETERVAAHVNGCKGCQLQSRELAGRAARVGAALAELSDSESTAPAIRTRAPNRHAARRLWRWAVPVAALAAGLALAALPLLRRRDPVAAPSPAPTAAAAAAEPGPASARQTAAAPMVVQPRRRSTARKHAAKPTSGYFLALDDEPIETGVVMRVGSKSGEFAADVIVGPDGRARAIRILDGKSDL
jgi:anti-sigma factor RsiW